ncbi:hypothetical protein [Chthonobacter albigriseus]|uniref:hypothetical protein n=1 Tax=Chthonobacter albigriseus TaxID=1683161 RepID=UPI0015EFC333|nr:hypothetical protein [Chthonobacter albigriseus]
MPEAAAGTGLSLFLCRYHRQFKARHGSEWKRSYSAADLAPYRRAAARYLKPRKPDFWIANALIAIETLLASGRSTRITDLRRANPDVKARAAFARLRDAKIPPAVILERCVAVLAMHLEDHSKPSGREFLDVQLAKSVHRLAAGKRTSYGPGSSWYRAAKSSGQVLRTLGRTLRTACEFVEAEHVPAVLALKVERDGAKPYRQEPLVRSRFGNDRAPPPIPPEDRPLAGDGDITPRMVEEEARKIRRRFREIGWKAFEGEF